MASFPAKIPKDQLERLKEYLEGLDLDLAVSVPLIGSLMGLPEDEEYPAPLVTPQRQKELTIEPISTWLVALKAHKSPLLFIVEDLHWIDPLDARSAGVPRGLSAGRLDHVRLHVPSRVQDPVDQPARHADRAQPAHAIADSRDDSEPRGRRRSCRVP